MKRTFALFLALCLMVAAAAALAEKKPNPTINKEYNPRSMMTMDGKTITINPEETMLYGENYTGFSHLVPKELIEILQKDPLPVCEYTEFGSYIGYIPEAYLPVLEGICSEKDEAKLEALYRTRSDKAYLLFCTFRVNPKNADAQREIEYYRSKLKHVELIAQVGEDQYFFGYNDTIEGSDLSQRDKETIATLYTFMKPIKDSLMLFPAVDDTESPENGIGEPTVVSSLSGIKTKDLKGEAADDSIFGSYDLTMVNIWDTQCGACISEMGELVKLKGLLPANANLISVCLDGGTEPELAQKILDSVKADFRTLVPDSATAKAYFEHITALPTTVFVDRQGNAVGRSVMGVPGHQDGAAAGYLEMINRRLEANKK